MSLSPTLQRLRDALTLAEEGRCCFAFSVELRTSSRLNDRKHWAKVGRSSKDARTLLKKATGNPVSLKKHLAAGGGAVVVVTRFAPRQLDYAENLGASLKGAVDGICDALEVSDGPKSPVLFIPDQERSKEYRVGVRIWLQNGASVGVEKPDSQSTTSQGGASTAVKRDSGQSEKLDGVGCSLSAFHFNGAEEQAFEEVPDGTLREPGWREQVDSALKAVGKKADWRAMATPNYEKGTK